MELRDVYWNILHLYIVFCLLLCQVFFPEGTRIREKYDHGLLRKIFLWWVMLRGGKGNQEAQELHEFFLLGFNWARTLVNETGTVCVHKATATHKQTTYPCATGTTVPKSPKSTIKTNKTPECFTNVSILTLFCTLKFMFFSFPDYNVQKTLLSLCCEPSKQDLFFWNYFYSTFAFIMLAKKGKFCIVLGFFSPLWFVQSPIHAGLGISLWVVNDSVPRSSSC